MSEHLAILLAALAGASIGLIVGLVILSRGLEARVKALLEVRLKEMEGRADRSESRFQDESARPGLVIPRHARDERDKDSARGEPVEPQARHERGLDSTAASRKTSGPELVAVITAAAYAAIGQPVVLRYALLLADDHHTSWRLVGRTDIFLSHNLRRAT